MVTGISPYAEAARLGAIGGITVLILVILFSPAHAKDARPPDSSRILEIYETEADVAARDVRTAAPLDLAGYRRPDMIGYIYRGEFALVPATGLDNLRYYAQAVADLTARCPALNLDAAQFDILPYLFSNVTDLVDRFQSGRLTQSEVLQAAWMAMLGLSQHRSCQWDADGPLTREQAQSQCDTAAQDLASAGVLPSFDAKHDMQRFLARHRCSSAEARRLARQLLAFGREAHTRTYFTPTMPSPDSQQGKTYSAILANCLRPAAGDAESQWCGCYVQTLHALDPRDEVLEALANNPFVDGSTYMSEVMANVQDGRALYECENMYQGKPDWRESYAPRTTACLVDEKPATVGLRECHYRAAWGEFTLTNDKCAPEISSRRWGYREVDCKKGGVVAMATAGPREWQDGAFTTIDYEQEVPPDFTPPLPPDAAKKYPLQIRLTKRNTPGLLKSLSLVPLTRTDLFFMGMPMRSMDAATPDIMAIDREGRLLLVCNYKTKRGVSSRRYWYEQVPRHVSAGRLSSAVRPYFRRISGAATTCPARDPIP